MPPGLNQAFPAFVTLTNALVNLYEILFFSLVLFEYPPVSQSSQNTKKNFYLFFCPKLNTVF